MIDTYTLVENLKASGFNERQARSISAAVRELESDIVTKENLKAYLEAALAKNFARNLLAQIAIAGVVIAAIKLL